MALSNDIISQFVKATKDTPVKNTESVVYGYIRVINDNIFVKLDGSDILTPINTTADVKDGDRVRVNIKDHTAMITGNITSPSARTDDVKDIDANVTEVREKVEKLDLVIADKADIKDLNAEKARINELTADHGEFKEVVTKDIEAINLDLKGKLSVNDADIKYANIDFSNIGNAAMEYFYANSGLIKNVVVGDATIAGELVGVTISGDLIKGNTIVAEKLVIKGEDGLYYKLNTDGIDIEKEQTDYNSLNGTVIQAKSITASKIAVDDLVAFDATIGGFNITTNSLYSGAKASVHNSTRGIYFDTEGQAAFGDDTNFIKYYRVSDGSYKLSISADRIIFGSGKHSVDDAVADVIVEHALGDSPTVAPVDGWSSTTPEWTDGKYVWQRVTKLTFNGSVVSSNETCITGAKGDKGGKGEDAVLLQIISSSGNLFKNSAVSTTLTVEIIVGGVRLTSSRDMYAHFGGNAHIKWQQKKFEETEYSDIPDSDPRISDNGFIFTINAEDINLQTVYGCMLEY